MFTHINDEILRRQGKTKPTQRQKTKAKKKKKHVKKNIN